MVSKKPKHINVLVVEDEEALRGLIAQRLRLKHYQAFEAATVTEAFGKINNYRFDLIIFDLNLNEESGTDLIKYVRTHPRSRNFNTPIIVISGELDPKVLVALKGMISHAFVKPFESDELDKKVEEIAGKPTPPDEKAG